MPNGNGPRLIPRCVTCCLPITQKAIFADLSNLSRIPKLCERRQVERASGTAVPLAHAQ